MAILLGMATPNTESQERTVPAGEFKTNCLRLMDEVHETGAGMLRLLKGEAGGGGAPGTPSARLGPVRAGLAGRGGVAVSAMTFVETTRLHHHGRIDLGCHPALWRRERLRSGLREIAVSGEIAVESVLLMNSGFRSDPADQIIVATAMLAGMRLATTDRQIIDWAQRTRLIPLAAPITVSGPP